MDAAADNNEFFCGPFKGWMSFPAQHTLRWGADARPPPHHSRTISDILAPTRESSDRSRLMQLTGVDAVPDGIDNGVFELSLQDRHGNAPIAINLPGQARSPARIAAARPWKLRRSAPSVPQTFCQRWSVSGPRSWMIVY